MWNLTNQRFIPQSIAFFYYNIQDKYLSLTNSVDRSYIPSTWNDLNEGASFLSNTGDCWMTYIPSSMLLFLTMHVAYKILRHFNIKFYDRITGFRWTSVLVTSVIMQNIQFIAFRSFQQIKYGGVLSAEPAVSVYFLDQIVCYLSLFFVTVYACCGYGILHALIGRNVKYSLDSILYSHRAAWFLGVTQLIKITNGFAHAWFYDNSPVQISLVLGGQLIVLSGLVKFRKIFRNKSFLTMYIYEQILRVVICLYLTLRVFLCGD